MRKRQRVTPPVNSLLGRKLYFPRLSIDGASALAAVYRSFGIDAQLVPESDAYSNDLARQYTIGEECYPQIITLGSFLKIMEDENFQPDKTAFMMPTTGGPCRFGQYKPLLEKILFDKDFDQVLIVSPNSNEGYDDIDDGSGGILRVGWWAVVCSDILRKLLLQTRPYEKNSGDADRAHRKGLKMICRILEQKGVPIKRKFEMLMETMEDLIKIFSNVPAKYIKSKPLIGIVGEIYCRLDNFANAELIRRIESYGGEVWLAPVAEWVWYSNFYQNQQLMIQGKRFSAAMLSTMVKNIIQYKDERKLLTHFQQRFTGYEEPHNIKSMLGPAEPYLPHWGVVGEMLLNIGGSISMYGKGVDGIIDISPFTCMNGIVCEAIYPKVSQDHDNIPIKNFYFDGTDSDYDRDVEIFLELALSYKKRKKIKRIYPPHFA